jgi:plastocyanin
MSTSPLRSSRSPVTAICLASAAAVTILAGCGSPAAATGASTGSSSMSGMSRGMSSGMSPGSSSAVSSRVVIHISKFAYTTPASVAPGATVTVMNMDAVKHTVTADSGKAFDTAVPAGASTTFTAPMKPGSYPFHCTYHSNMHGTLVVR